MTERLRERYPPWRIDQLPGGCRVVSSNGFTLTWSYSADGIARSADPLKLTHAEARTMAQTTAKLGG